MRPRKPSAATAAAPYAVQCMQAHGRGELERHTLPTEGDELPTKHKHCAVGHAPPLPPRRYT